MGDLIPMVRPGGNGSWALVARAIATVAAILVYGWINFLLYPASAPCWPAQVAGKQFENSNTSYVDPCSG